MFWKVRAMPWRGRHVGLEPLALLAAVEDPAFLRVIDAVDDVQHRALAGAVGADDRADLVLAHVEADVGERLHAAEAQRDVLQVQDHVAEAAARIRGGSRGGGVDVGHVHSSSPQAARWPACGAKVFASSMRRSAETLPTRPSS